MDRSQILRVMVPMGALSALLLIVAVVVVLTGGARNTSGFTLSTEPVQEEVPPPSVIGDQPQGKISTMTFDSVSLDDPNWKFVNQNTLPGLKYIDIKVGEGEVVPPGVKVTVHYTGWRTDGVKFDSSYDHGSEPSTFGLTQVIVGWTQGLPGMRAGGVRRLYVPSQFAYGAKGSGAKIPPNTDLVFEVEMLNSGNHRR